MPRDLGPDVSHRVDVDSRSLVPDGPAPTGHRLTVTGQEPFEFAWRQPEEKQVREGNGDPNGNVTASKGTLYVERDAPSLWQNDDGLTLWTEVGAGAAGSFPITRDDGTNTYTLDAGAPGWGTGQFAMHQELDADPTVYADVITFTDADFADALIDMQGNPGEAKIHVSAGDAFGNIELVGDTGSNVASIALEADDSNSPETQITLIADNITIAAGAGLGFNAQSPMAVPTITGSRGGNAALADLITQLELYGLIFDGTSA